MVRLDPGPTPTPSDKEQGTGHRLANIESVIVGKQHSPQTIDICQADGEPESASPTRLAVGSMASEEAQLRPVLGALVDLHRRMAASPGLLELFDVRDR